MSASYASLVREEFYNSLVKVLREAINDVDRRLKEENTND